MKPEVDEILRLSAQQLIAALAPQLPTRYAQGSASLLGFMMLLAAQEYDRAAEIRAAENADIRKLFRESVNEIDDAALKSALAEAGASADGSLKISDLDAANAALRRLLIRLQIFAEDRGLQALERRIWDVLKASADRRLLRVA